MILFSNIINFFFNLLSTFKDYFDDNKFLLWQLSATIGPAACNFINNKYFHRYFSRIVLNLKKQILNKHFSVTASNKAEIKNKQKKLEREIKQIIFKNSYLTYFSLDRFLYVFLLMQTTYNCVDKILTFGF